MYGGLDYFHKLGVGGMISIKISVNYLNILVRSVSGIPGPKSDKAACDLPDG